VTLVRIEKANTAQGQSPLVSHPPRGQLPTPALALRCNTAILQAKKQVIHEMVLPHRPHRGH
jgi:hypothetical protein